MFGIERVDAPVTGNGLYQFQLTDSGFINHGLLLQTPAARRQVGHYFETAWRTGRAEVIQP